jgi:hypothetical protein
MAFVLMLAAAAALFAAAGWGSFALVILLVPTAVYCTFKIIQGGAIIAHDAWEYRRGIAKWGGIVVLCYAVPVALAIVARFLFLWV